jgi:hypothetical protein
MNKTIKMGLLMVNVLAAATISATRIVNDVPGTQIHVVQIWEGRTAQNEPVFANGQIADLAIIPAAQGAWAVLSKNTYVWITGQGLPENGRSFMMTDSSTGRVINLSDILGAPYAPLVRVANVGGAQVEEIPL